MRSVDEAQARSEGLEVLDELEDPDDGWYRVRIGGDEGFMFGAFVLPPSPGRCVGKAEGKPTVEDEDGGRIQAPPAGTRVLMTATDPEDGRWPVLLPDGQPGFVAEDGIEVVDCTT